MHKIIGKRQLAVNIFEYVINAPEIAKKVKAGQFLILRIDDFGERIPLTFCDWDTVSGTITIAFLVVGKTTKYLSTLEVGDYIKDIAGPLGHPTEVEKAGNIVCIAGGVGSAEMKPTAKAFKADGNRVTVIEGARSANLLIYEDELSAISDRFLVATDDGSKGYHDFGVALLKQLLETEKIDLVHTVGPAIMMKAVAETTRPYGVKTVVSLNPIMLDGSGMCGACRVEVSGKTFFGCVDGPEFDGHQVNWDLLLLRQKSYLKHEKKSLAVFSNDTNCCSGKENHHHDKDECKCQSKTSVV